MNYRDLNALMSKATEADLETLLAREVGGEKRYTFLVRIHQHLSALRVARERASLLMSCGYADRVKK